MEYRPIEYFQNGVPYATGDIKLDVADMRDESGVATVDIALAYDAYLALDPTAGVVFGNADPKYHMNYVLDGDYVTIHAIEELDGTFSDVEYIVIYKSMAARKAGDIVDTFYHRLAELDIKDFDNTAVRTMISEIATASGYPSALGATSIYVLQPVYEVMVNDYLAHVAETGVDSYGYFTVQETEDVTWLVECRNIGDNIGVQATEVRKVGSLAPRRFGNAPRRIKEAMGVVETDIDGMIYNKVGDHLNIHDYARALTLRPVDDLQVTVVTSNYVLISIILDNQPRSPQAIKRELMALAETELAGA